MVLVFRKRFNIRLKEQINFLKKQKRFSDVQKTINAVISIINKIEKDPYNISSKEILYKNKVFRSIHYKNTLYVLYYIQGNKIVVATLIHSSMDGIEYLSNN